jgi:type VI secretion system protein ImpG
MDPRLLQYYNLELQHLREMGAEFAQQFPKIAARLGMTGIEVADPYVERLLEGAAFLAARVQLKIDAEFPRFTQALLEAVYPHYLAPTPSMLVAQCRPDPDAPNLATGFTVARGSTLHGLLGSDDVTACEFRTAHDVHLWPVAVAAASYFTFAPDLPLNAVPVSARIKGGVRLRLDATAGLRFSQMRLDRLTFYLSGGHDVANALYELCLAHPLGVLVRPAAGSPHPPEFLPASAVRPIGFADDEALLPVTLRSFQGYRLLQEYFALPQRFRFFEVSGLAPVVARTDAQALELVVLFGRGDPGLEHVVDASNFSLFCTPAVNLFAKRADRIHVSDRAHEYPVVPDRTRPLDFEVYEVGGVVGHGVGADSEQAFLPFYATRHGEGHGRASAFFTTRRVPRLVSASQQRRGSRSSYIGTEVFLALVDADEAPFSGDLRQLSVQTICTNRDLVLQMPVGTGPGDLSLDLAAPVSAVRVVAGPSRPSAPLAEGAVAWRAISHLTLNYVSLVDASPEAGATALRDILDLYASSADAAARKQIEGVRRVRATPVVRRLPPPSAGSTRRGAASTLAFGRGLEIAIEVDDLSFEGGSAYLLGAVLDRYLARYVSINSFTETVLRSQARGEINRWMPQWGLRPTL